MSYVLSLISACLVPCTILIPTSALAQTMEKTDTPVEIRIDPASAQIEKPATDHLSAVDYLPLQTTKASAFGEISQLEITSKFYIIWDHITNAILFFDKSGTFVTKITNTDKSLTTPYKKIDHFTVNEVKGELMFNDSHADVVYYYDLEGKFIKMVKRPSYIGAFYINRENYSAYFAGYDSWYLKSLKKADHNLIIDRRNGDIDFYLPFDTTSVEYTDLYAVDQVFYSNLNGIVNFSIPYNYNVYAINASGKMWNSFKFVMPALNSIPDDFLTKSEYKGNRMKYTGTHEEVIYSINDVYQVKEEIIFRLFGRRYRDVMSFNITTGDLVSLSNLAPDNLTYMLPAVSNRIYAMDDQRRLVSSINATDLFSLSSKLGGSKWANSLPTSLKTFFENGEDQNPVLILLTLK